jgi:large subunit ribosomal protein L43
MNSFIRHHLPLLAKQYPQIEIAVSPRPNKHPVVRAHYVNGRNKAICVKNLEKLQIRQKVDLLKNDDGKKLVRSKKLVESTNESVRGIFSNIHANKISIGLDGWLQKKK